MIRNSMRHVQRLFFIALLVILMWNGNSLQADTAIGSDYYYMLSTNWQGDSKVLALESDNKTPMLSARSNDPSQLWKLNRMPNGYYRLTTKGQGEGFSLDIINDGANNKPVLAPTGNFTGQMWKLTPLSGGYYRLTTNWQGDGKSLDIVNDGRNNQPILANTGNFTGQMWKLTKTEVQTSLLGPGNFAQDATVTKKFINQGTKQVSIYRSTPTGLGDKVTDIRNHSTVEIPVRIGDQFEVMIDGTTSYHPKIYISDLDSQGVIIHGNPPFSEFPQKVDLGSTLSDYQPNLTGIDLRVLNPRDLVDTINKGKVFEALDPINGVDYHHDGNKVMKYGFTYAGTNQHEGSNDVRLAYGYSAFSKSWGVNVGAKGNVKGVDVGLDVGYESFEQEETSSENVYAYSREQKSVFVVSVEPIKARLETAFKLAVLAVDSGQDAKRFIQKYGTHFPTVVHYGGDRSVYVVMNKNQYSRAKGYGIDIRAEVSKSKNMVTSTSYTRKSDDSWSSTDNYGDSKVASGSLAFSYSEDEQVKEVFESTRSRYRIIGGTGGFEGWSVDEGDAAPVAVELEYLYELIDPRVFKDGTDAAVLRQKQQLIKTATFEHLRDMPRLAASLPAPRVYSVTLDQLRVTEEVDDLDKATRGSVTATLVPAVAGFDGTLWSRPEWSDDLRYEKGKTLRVGRKAVVVQHPPATGAFPPLILTLSADITERDHCCGDERHAGAASVSLDDLEVNETRQVAFDAKAYTTFAEKGTIKVITTVRREPSEFFQ